MAARSTHVFFQNRTRTNVALELVQQDLDHGVWSIRPGDLVGFSDEWESESNGFLTGTEGTVSFIIPAAEFGTHTPQMKVVMHWDNPFVGSNSYSCSVEPAGDTEGNGFSVGFFGNKRMENDAEVTFVLLSGKCSINPDNGEIACTQAGGLSSPPDGGLYTGIWQLKEGAPWQARHGMTSTQYQQIFIQMLNTGFRLVHVSGYDINGIDRYAAIWEQREGPPFEARHGLSAAEYQQAFDQLISEGYKLVKVSGYQLNNSDHYAAIWEQVDSNPWQARHALTADQYQKVFDELLNQGFRLIHISGYAVGGQDFYAGIWEQIPGAEWQARHRLTADQYQQTFDQMLADGFGLRQVCGYKVGDVDFYAAIWDKPLDIPWQARHRLDSTKYQQTFNELLRQGFRLVDVSGYPER
ncbi:hypothetical protein GS399_04735 [Pedobacter sp. HMF7647]|uniref:Uncharacterized protein n=1 Tax=Hufsiella arboris TaxID=2695275 RepID=A0A7K1Y892_9SPHI|nr:hypothetical protein [Hufsiella arboris]MXV50268.1 hypothetical protein [Hufsiella arboris]